jgi:putative nucleotidyltransferase with HDIG domain
MPTEHPARTWEEAEELLRSLAPPDEPWIHHSPRTSEVAGRIADALAEAGQNLDPAYIRICGLLHDVGRSVDHGFLHGWEGYRIMMERGFGAYAKCCVSHWFKGRSKKLIHDENISLETALLEQDIYDEVGADTFELDEKTVALADSMTLVEKVVTIDERYDEAEERYGISPWITGNRRISHALWEEFSTLLGYDLETLFPELKKQT